MKFNIPEEHKKSAGIYIIKSTVNDKFYIGSTECFRRRYIAHRTALRNTRHHNTYLQNHSNKHGIDVLVFESLEYLPKDKGLLIEREQHYLDLFSANSNGFNLAQKAGIPTVGPRTDKEKQKISIKLKAYNKEGKRYWSTRYLKDKKCPVCCKKFRPNSKHSVYCSRSCFGIGTRTLKNKKCATCDALFRPRNERQKFCKKDCEKHSRTIRPYTFQCVNCECKFKSMQLHRKYCSLECMHLYQQIRFDITCSVCDTVFETNKANRIYCSQACYRKHRYST